MLKRIHNLKKDKQMKKRNNFRTKLREKTCKERPMKKKVRIKKKWKNGNWNSEKLKKLQNYIGNGKNKSLKSNNRRRGSMN